MKKKSASFRRIAVVTGTRADYGLLRPVIRALGKHRNVERQLVVTGMHLLGFFGSTEQEIERDGIRTVIRVPVMDDDKASAPHMARTLARAIGELSKAFDKHDPHVVVVLGDRVETFAAGVAAALTGRVVAHIHGGDVTRGGYDESMRHALTKFAHVHFAATPGAKRRIIKMGEDPANVYLTGAPGIDELLHEPRLDAAGVEREYGVKRKDYVLLVQHPVSTEPQQARRQFFETLCALEKLQRPIIAVYPNNDPGADGIVADLLLAEKGKASNFMRAHGKPKPYAFRSLRTYPSLPREHFLGLMEHAGAICGNSSSGVIEAGYLRTPAVNIGERQEGRECGVNVLHVAPAAKAIEAALRRCFEDKAFLAKIKRLTPKSLPYGNGRAGEKIATVLAKHPLPPELTHKKLCM